MPRPALEKAARALVDGAQLAVRIVGRAAHDDAQHRIDEQLGRKVDQRACRPVKQIRPSGFLRFALENQLREVRQQQVTGREVARSRGIPEHTAHEIAQRAEDDRAKVAPLFIGGVPALDGGLPQRHRVRRAHEQLRLLLDCLDVAACQQAIDCGREHLRGWIAREERPDVLVVEDAQQHGPREGSERPQPRQGSPEDGLHRIEEVVLMMSARLWHQHIPAVRDAASH